MSALRDFKPNSKALSERSELGKYLLIIMCVNLFNNGWHAIICQLR